MTPSHTPGSQHELHRKPVAPPIPDPAAVPDDAGRDDASGYGSPVLVGSNTSGLQQAASAAPGTTHGAASGGERGAAGRSDGTRSSRDHDGSLDA